MRYGIGIDVDHNGATVVIMDETGRLLPVEKDLSFVPRTGIISATGERLVGMRAQRYGHAHGLVPDVAEEMEWFACVAQGLRRLLPQGSLPVVLSCWTTDPFVQSRLAQAAYDAGLHVLRVINRAVACAIACAVPAGMDRKYTLCVDCQAGETVLMAEADSSDEVLEILSCKEYAVQDVVPYDSSAIYYTYDGSASDVRSVAAYGAVFHAAMLKGIPAIPGYLMLDVLAHSICIQNDDQLQKLLADNTSFPVRHIVTLAAHGLRDAEGCLYYAFSDHYDAARGRIALQSDALKHCAQLELTLSVDSTHNTTLTVTDPVTKASERFELLRFVQAAPPVEAENISLPDARQMLDTLLEAMDGLENGLRMLSAEDRESAVGKGMLQIHKRFSAALKDMGVVSVPAEGCRFDPQVHEAVVTMPHEESGLVLQEYRRGYMRNGVLLRAAQVMVSE